MTLRIAITIIGAYLLGGVNGAIVISKVFFKNDVRRFGSGNAGLTNFMRAFGSGQAAFVFIIDFIKCVTACLIGGLLLRPYGYGPEGRVLAGLFVILGHMFPAYYHFKGGKGIVCGAALALMIDWRVFVTAVGVFIIVTAISKMVSAGSVIGAIALTGFTWLFHPDLPLVILTALVTCLIVFMHRGNIVRIVHGEERKLTMDQFRKR